MRTIGKFVIATLAYVAGNMLFGDSYFAGYVMGLTVMALASIEEDVHDELKRP